MMEEKDSSDAEQLCFCSGLWHSQLLFKQMCTSVTTVQYDGLSCMLRSAVGFDNWTNTKTQAFYFSDVFTSQMINNSIKTRVLQVKYATHVECCIS